MARVRALSKLTTMEIKIHNELEGDTVDDVYINSI